MTVTDCICCKRRGADDDCDCDEHYWCETCMSCGVHCKCVVPSSAEGGDFDVEPTVIVEQKKKK